VQVQRGEHLAANRPHAAVRIRHAHAKEHVEHPRQNRVADPAVRPRHGVLVNAAVEPRAHDQVVPGVERLDESRQLVQRVGLVRVPHDDVAAARLRQPSEVRAPVPAARLGHDGGAVRGRYLGRAVGRAVVDDDHLTGTARGLDALPCLVDHCADRALLVEARNDDGDLDDGSAVITLRHRYSHAAGR
jgi:hypothetical protein